MRWKKQYDMKHLKVAGLCLVSMLVLGMALAGNVSAAPLWVVCLEGSGLTKYSSNQCTEAGSTGKWQSSGIPPGSSVTVRLLVFSLRLEDTGAGVVVECPDAGSLGSGMGLVESPNQGKITKMEFNEPEKEGCKVVKGSLTCKAGTLEKIKGVGLPWTTEITETEGKSSSQIMSSSNPGWTVSCGGAADECVEEESKPESVELESKVTKGVSLVLAILESKGKEKCSVGGTEKGKISGLFSLSLANGNGLKMSFPPPPLFTVTGSNDGNLIKVGKEALFEITNFAGAANEEVRKPFVIRSRGGFTHNVTESETCENKEYAMGEKCSFKVKYEKKDPGDNYIVLIVDSKNGGYSAYQIRGE
jgi:hypothetical protein